MYTRLLVLMCALLLPASQALAAACAAHCATRAADAGPAAHDHHDHHAALHELPASGDGAQGVPTHDAGDACPAGAAACCHATALAAGAPLLAGVAAPAMPTGLPRPAGLVSPPLESPERPPRG